MHTSGTNSDKPASVFRGLLTVNEEDVLLSAADPREADFVQLDALDHLQVVHELHALLLILVDLLQVLQVEVDPVDALRKEIGVVHSYLC